MVSSWHHVVYHGVSIDLIFFERIHLIYKPFFTRRELFVYVLFVRFVFLKTP